MRLRWSAQNELVLDVLGDRFRRAVIGERYGGEWNGALILLHRGDASCSHEVSTPVRKSTCLWLSRQHEGACKLTDDANGIITLVRFPHGRHFPDSSRAMIATPLLYAVIERLAELDIDTCPVRASYEDVATEEILRDLDAAAAAQVPRSSGLQLWALAYMQDPRVTTSIEDAAGAARMSVRSFTRHFKRETGEPFRSWKLRTLTNKAKSLLHVGRTVSEVSSELAYESVSSFIAMFKDATGKTPGEYVRDSKIAPDRAVRTSEDKPQGQEREDPLPPVDN